MLNTLKKKVKAMEFSVIFTIIFPVITLVIGWLLNVLYRYFIANYERHGAIGQTLSNLLLIRSHMANIQVFSNYITTRMKPPLPTIPEYKKLYREIFPFYDEAHQKINDSITVIASSDPVLASKLRLNELGVDIFSKLSSKVESYDDEDRLFLDFISNIDDKILPYLDDIILKLAKKHGKLTHFRAKRFMREKIDVTGDMDSALKEFQKKLEELREEKTK